MFDSDKHYQQDLADFLGCSPQTVIRLTSEIELVVGKSLVKGMDSHKRWYQLKPINPLARGLGHLELWYLGLCRDLASHMLPAQVLSRLDRSIMDLSLIISDECPSKNSLMFYPKGRIDYSGKEDILDKLVRARDSGKLCLLTYKDPGMEEASTHYFAPARIISVDNALYALGTDATKEGKRIGETNFAVHRIRLVSLLDTPYKGRMPEGSAPGGFGIPQSPDQTYRMRFKAGKSADYVGERLWGDRQSVENLPGGDLLLTITTGSDREIRAWIASFGTECSLLSVSDAGA
jgi:hypothetical protein